MVIGVDIMPKATACAFMGIQTASEFKMSLYYEHVQTRSSQITTADQAIVSSPDYDPVVFVSHSLFPPTFSYRSNRSRLDVSRIPSMAEDRPDLINLSSLKEIIPPK
jgi:hypothetical protein